LTSRKSASFIPILSVRSLIVVHFLRRRCSPQG
jgi:hypothetical protein